MVFSTLSGEQGAGDTINDARGKEIARVSLLESLLTSCPSTLPTSQAGAACLALPCLPCPWLHLALTHAAGRSVQPLISEPVAYQLTRVSAIPSSDINDMPSKQLKSAHTTHA